MRHALLLLCLCTSAYCAETELPADTRFDIVNAGHGLVLKLDKNTGATWFQKTTHNQNGWNADGTPNWVDVHVVWVALGRGDGGNKPHWKLVTGSGSIELINADTGDSWMLKSTRTVQGNLLTWEKASQ